MPKKYLRPCPFCGAAAKLWNSYADEWNAGCRNVDCHIMPRTMGLHQGDASGHWNARVIYPRRIKK